MKQKIRHRILPASGSLLERLIAARGVITKDGAIKDILPHTTLLNANKAALILADAIEKRLHITIAGDYDVDGATGVAVAIRGMRLMGGDPDFIVPDRIKHGYGLSPALVDLIAARGTQLIVTVDNGISSFAGVDHANALGIPVVVTDHHMAADRLPDALCIVNPNQPDCTFESKALSGAGVMFYVMMSLRAEMAKRGLSPVPQLGDLLDLVALSTIADVVRLDHNNRILTRAGLQRIRAGRTVPLITALLEIAKRTQERASSADLGFAVGPRLNAAGRLEDMTLGIKGLLTNDLAEARRIATELDSINKQRKEIETTMKDEALAMLGRISPDLLTQSDLDPAVVLHHPDWHAGVIGILASRIREDQNRPAIMFAAGDDGTLKGSGRSIPTLNIRDAIDLVAKRVPDAIIAFGGHAMAAGLTIRAGQLELFRTQFNLAVSQMLEGVDTAQVFETDGSMPSLTIEDILAADAEPWGAGYPPPEFDDDFAVARQKLIGGGKHLKLQVKRGNELFDAVMFFQETELPERFHAVFTPAINEYQGMQSIQLLVNRVTDLPELVHQVVERQEDNQADRSRDVPVACTPTNG